MASQIAVDAEHTGAEKKNAGEYREKDNVTESGKERREIPLRHTHKYNYAITK
jgi:hypothetical protein